MKYHLIVNGCSDDFLKQIRELTGFAVQSGLKQENGNTIIICERRLDGDGKQQLAELAPTRSVIFLIVEYYDPEVILDKLEQLIGKEETGLFGSNYSGDELAVRSGKRMAGSSLTGCMALKIQEGRLLAEKMVYSNHMKGTFLLQHLPCFISIAKGQTKEVEAEARQHQIVEYDLSSQAKQLAGLNRSVQSVTTENALADAAFAIVVGRGVRKRADVEALEELAADIDAAFGASRPVAMNAWVPMQKLVGVSGAMPRPRVCIAAGVSGAPALYAGIEKSSLIVAINTDERAPIMKKADVAIAGDCMEVLRELRALIRKEEADE